MQLYLPPSITHYNFIWPISQANAAAMAVLFDVICAAKPELTVITESKLPDSFITANQACKLAQPDSQVYSAQHWPEPKATELRRFTRNHFPSISYFTGLPNKESLEHFSDNSVNLIWLQNHDLNHDLIEEICETWLEKMTHDGLLILHSTNSKNTVKIKKSPSINCANIEKLKLDIYYTENTAPEVKQLIHLLQQDDGVRFYQSAGCYWSNITIVEQQKKAQLNKQLEKRFLAKHG